jgi:FkbM family methyltransferase
MRRAIQRFIRKFGYNVRVHTPVSDPFENLIWHARQRSVHTILDVGANIGQFAGRCIDAGWRSKLVSFECLKEAHSSLEELSAGNSNWVIAPRAAIGSNVGVAKVNRAVNSQSSSLLPVAAAVHRGAPNAVYVEQQEVGMETLDHLVPLMGLTAPFLLKMDVQGFEAEVLKGAPETLRRTAIIYTEMSLLPLYEGETDFTVLSRQIMDAGFRCIGIYPGYWDGETREIVQVDAIFVQV